MGAKLVVDANIIFAALTKRSFTFDFIRLLHKLGFELYSPQYILEEIDEKMDRLLRFSKLEREELEFLIKLLFKKIIIVPESEYDAYLPEAKKLLTEHSEDYPYLALSIALDCPLWSNEELLKKQSRVEVLATHELKFMV